jgi:hypothetical protein
MATAEIQALAQRRDTTSSTAEEQAWRPLSLLGGEVVPCLAGVSLGALCPLPRSGVPVRAAGDD